MKPNQTATIHHVDRITDEVPMGIAQDAMAHIMTVLTDLYSDRQMAVIREYSTNAWDSHVDSGNTKPIEVTLPTQMNPNFSVRDQGVGLNMDDIRNIYANYGSSTKRGSDEVTGMLGLGCKSALTYAMSFTVDSVKDGQRIVAIVTKDAQGVGTIKILDTIPTDEPNGVTVTVPVKPQDVGSFCQKALHFYSFWQPGQVSIAGHEIEYVRDREGADILWIDEDVAVSRTRGQSYIIMGNVPYPVNFQNIPNAHSLLQYQIIAYVPIGCVNFTPSRESLMNTKATEATLATLVDYINDRFVQMLNSKLAASSSNWDRAKVFQQWRWSANSAHQIKGFTTSGFSSSLILKDKTAWLFDRYAEKFSKFQQSIDWGSISNEAYPIITGYPHRGIIQSARHRVRDFLSKELNSPGQGFVIPEGVTIDVLEGRPKVFTWDYVLDHTDAPPKEARNKNDVIYTFYLDGKVGYNTGQFTDTDPILYAPVSEVPVTLKENTRHYYHSNRNNSYIDPRTVAEYSTLYKGVRWVSITEQQVEKFKRLHPHARRWSVHVTELREKALDSLTEVDKQSQHLDGGVTNFAADLAASKFKISDPEILKISKLQGHKSAAIDECKRLGLTIPPPKDKVTLNIANRYPLVANIYSHAYNGRISGNENMRDLALYVEAKYAVLNP